MNRKGFVRDNMIPAATPPLSEGTVVGWLRNNLFNGWLNSLLSVAFLVAVAFILYSFLPWALRSSWTATSLSECREAIALAYGEHVGGACWAVIRERYLQLFYGFYPSELYWRPNLVFVMMLIALAPILFPIIPRRVLQFTAVYPFLAYWLLWGGSIWAPLMVIAGILLGILTYRLISRDGLLVPLGTATIVVVFWWLYGVIPAAAFLNDLLPLGIRIVESDQFGGFVLSIIIGVTGIAASLPIGILLALGRKSDMLFVKMISVGFIEFIRGVPLITLLFVASILLNIFLPPGTNFDIILRVIVMVTLFASAYMAEVIRGGLAALPKGQYEASDALGLDYWKSMRLIILPQALKVSIPGIVSTFIGLFKDTTLVSIIGLLDPIGLAGAIRANTAWHGIVWELYFFIALMFFVFCFSMSRYSMYLERRLATDND